MIPFEEASLWLSGKEIQLSKKLGDFTGKNEKTKVIAKIQKKRSWCTKAREPVVSEEEGKK